MWSWLSTRWVSSLTTVHGQGQTDNERESWWRTMCYRTKNQRSRMPTWGSLCTYTTLTRFNGSENNYAGNLISTNEMYSIMMLFWIEWQKMCTNTKNQLSFRPFVHLNSSLITMKSSAVSVIIHLVLLFTAIVSSLIAIQKTAEKTFEFGHLIWSSLFSFPFFYLYDLNYHNIFHATHVYCDSSRYLLYFVVF